MKTRPKNISITAKTPREEELLLRVANSGRKKTITCNGKLYTVHGEVTDRSRILSKVGPDDKLYLVRRPKGERYYVARLLPSSDGVNRGELLTTT